MKITQLGGDGGRRVLQVEADWSELAADYDDIVVAYARVPLPGFRPGRVPRAVIEQRFRREIIDDLSNRAAERLGREALREAGIEALGPVEAEEIECEKDKRFRFRVRFHALPEFSLPDLSNLLIRQEGVDPRDQISHRLLDLVRFDVPDELVKDELTMDGINGGETGSPEWKAASDRIRLMLILKRIARQEGIEVDETDVVKRIAEKAREFETTIKRLQAELEKGGGKERLRDLLVAERTFEYLLENAQK